MLIVPFRIHNETWFWVKTRDDMNFDCGMQFQTFSLSLRVRNSDANDNNNDNDNEIVKENPIQMPSQTPF